MILNVKLNFFLSVVACLEMLSHSNQGKIRLLKTSRHETFGIRGISTINCCEMIFFKMKNDRRIIQFKVMITLIT